MTPILRNLLIGFAVILLLFELGFQIKESNEKTEKANPIDKTGKLKEGHTIPFEKEKEMAIDSFPSVQDKDFSDNLIFAFVQSLLFYETTGNTTTFGANIGTSSQFKELDNLSNSDKGKYILKLLTKERKVTNVKFTPSEVITNDTGNSPLYLYDVLISLDQDTEILEFEFEVIDRKINRITEKTY
jgi:hypothetical protein